MKAARLAPPPLEGQQAQEERRGQGAVLLTLALVPWRLPIGWLRSTQMLFTWAQGAAPGKYLVPGAVYKPSDPELPVHAATLMQL